MHTPNEFVLSFFQIEHPPFDLELTALSEVKSRCVARIFLSPDHMVRLVKMLNENLANVQQAAPGGSDEHE